MYVVFSMCKRNLLPFIFGDALCFQFLHIDLVGNVGQYVEMTCLFVCLKHILAVFLSELGIDFRHRTVFEQAGLQLFYLTFAGKRGVFSFHLELIDVSSDSSDRCTASSVSCTSSFSSVGDVFSSTGCCK